MHTIIGRSLRAVGAEQGVITLVDQEADKSMKTLVRTAVSSAGHSKYHFNQALLGWMHINKKPLTINSPSTDERFRGVRWDESIRSLLCVPMIAKSALRGVLTVYNKKGQSQFTEEDQRLLAIIAAQSAQVVETARLYEMEQSLIRMKEEVRLAARIQTDLLPNCPPTPPGYDISGKSVPAQMVGGDYFDFMQMPGGRYGVTLGDVSGKGLPAALLMANLQATLRGQTLFGGSVHECIQRSNKLLAESTSPEKFVTLFYSVLVPGARTLTYCNAGHDAPMLLRAGGVSGRSRSRRRRAKRKPTSSRPNAAIHSGRCGACGSCAQTMSTPSQRTCVASSGGEAGRARLAARFASAVTGGAPPETSRAA